MPKKQSLKASHFFPIQIFKVHYLTLWVMVFIEVTTMNKREPTTIETECVIEVTISGIYSPAEPSTGLPDGIDEFKVMLGPKDLTDAIPDREHQCLYNMLLDELRGEK